MWQNSTLILFFALAFLLSALITRSIVRYTGTYGLDQPDTHRKQHAAPVSRLGGLAIFVALSAGFVILALRLPHFIRDWMPIILANTIMFGIGFLDDLKPLGAKIKLVGQVGAALVLYSLGVSIDSLSNPFGSEQWQLGWWGLPITVLWLVAIPNIINLIDGMDGLASGFGMFLCLTLAFVGHLSGKPDVTLVCLVMAGALAGFLVYNFPPAKIFLGDGGAYLIGFFVASVSLMSSNKGSIIASLLVVIVALGVPILDTAFAIIRRAIRGMPIFRADAEHIHHRLILLGYSKTQALGVLYGVCAILSLAGLSIMLSRGFAIPIVGALAFLLALAAARYLGYIRRWSDVKKQFRAAMDRRRHRQYILAHGRLLEMEVERCHSPEEFAAILRPSLKRLGLSARQSQGTLPMRIRCLNGVQVVIYRAVDNSPEEEWQFRGEILEPALSRCLERWNEIPGLDQEPLESADQHDQATVG